MPHVVIKVWPGSTEAQKIKLSQEVTKSVGLTLGTSSDSISIAIEEVQPAEWMSSVYHPEIAPQMKNLYKKPGYKPW